MITQRFWSITSLTIIGLLAFTGCKSDGDEITQGDLVLDDGKLVEVSFDRLTQAEQAREDGEYAIALALFREILAENPTDTYAYLGIGDVYLEQENYYAAEPFYERAARITPKSYRAQSSYGYILQMLNRLVEAVGVYQKALLLDPDGLEANLGLGSTFLQLDEPERAIAYAQKAVNLEPTNGAARGNLGQVYEATGRSNEAIEQYLVALELVDQPGPVMKRLGKVLIAERRYVEAVNTIDSLTKLEPNAESFTLLGRAHFKQGDYANSSLAYQRATELDPNAWRAWNGVGVNALNRWILSGKSDHDAKFEARHAFRRSLRLNNNQPRVIIQMQKYGLQ
ncbi:MAG: tetratricopeptide repeat protein [Planctomycetota bacterium]|nr:tetratricopeptide repeat protein [Planctomycetota bacterium]